MKTQRIGKKRACVETGKICFKTHEKALNFIGKIISKEGRLYKWCAYLCRYCGRYHISSNRNAGLDVSKTKRIRRSLKMKGEIR